MSKIFTFFMFILMVVSCGGNSNNLVEGSTQVRVEYFGEMEASTCHPNLICRIRNNSECVTILYDKTKESAKKGLQAIKNKNYNQAAFEFSSALCNVQNIDVIFDRMKADNYNEWRELGKNGTIERMRLTGVQLSLIVDQCEDLARNLE